MTTIQLVIGSALTVELSWLIIIIMSIHILETAKVFFSVSVLATFF